MNIFLIIISLWSNLSYFIVLVHIWWVICRSPIILNLLIIHQFLRILNFSEYYINQFIKTKILASTWNLDSMEYYSKAFCPTQCVWGPHVLDCLFPATLSPVQMQEVHVHICWWSCMAKPTREHSQHDVKHQSMSPASSNAMLN